MSRYLLNVLDRKVAGTLDGQRQRLRRLWHKGCHRMPYGMPRVSERLKAPLWSAESSQEPESAPGGRGSKLWHCLDGTLTMLRSPQASLASPRKGICSGKTTPASRERSAYLSLSLRAAATSKSAVACPPPLLCEPLFQPRRRTRSGFPQPDRLRLAAQAVRRSVRSGRFQTWGRPRAG